MNKSELIDKVAEKAGVTKKDAAAAVQATFDAISGALERGERVRLVGFGSFDTRLKGERTYVNPQTKKPMTVPASRQVVFHAGKELKEQVAKG